MTTHGRGATSSPSIRARPLTWCRATHGPWWSDADVELLGVLPDVEVARRTGRTVGAVRQKRQELCIPNPTSGRWTAEQIALLGRMPDEDSK
jgi:hypothetical protein